MLLAYLPPDGVVQQRCRWEFELRAQESHDRFRMTSAGCNNRPG